MLYVYFVLYCIVLYYILYHILYYTLYIYYTGLRTARGEDCTVGAVEPACLVYIDIISYILYVALYHILYYVLYYIVYYVLYYIIHCIKKTDKLLEINNRLIVNS
jgi:hypothetical protein